MDKYITFRAKVVFAVLASIPIEWTHTLTYVCSGRVLEWPCAGVAGRARHAVQGRPAERKRVSMGSVTVVSGGSAYTTEYGLTGKRWW